ncbi:RelA/SpoT family protein [Candidatus Saccharibacteria bacterium]|nr:RelA/SpoT family protein [Candidatus Saccharibacteria bacterium]
MSKVKLLASAREVFDERQVIRLERAVEVAARAHEGQRRASGEKYIAHPLAVAELLMEWRMDIDTVVAGVLHDALEDTELEIREIEEEFGMVVAFLVDGVTKLGIARSGMREIDSYLPATRDNLTKLLIALGQDIRVVVIKLADRLHNLRTLKHLPAGKQKKIAKESLEVFAPLADKLNMGRVRVEIEEISFSYIDRARYEYLKGQSKRYLGRASGKLARARAGIEEVLKREKIEYEMDGRVKSIYSLHKKLAKTGENLDAIYDLIALRIIVEDKTDCYLALGLIHAIYRPMVARIKDYIAVPKQNGYQSLHTTVITPDEYIVEFQVRTREMHEYAERGLAASFHYNEQKLTDAYAQGKIAAMPANLHWIHDLQKAAALIGAGEEVDLEKMKLSMFRDRIFVFSPKGDIFDLPEGATVLDYAYRVHTDIGDTAYAFRVNGKIVKFDEEVKSGDVVEVVTRKDKRPNVDWLGKVKARGTKGKIRKRLKEGRE